MTIAPAYWTLIGEITAVIFGVLIAVIIVIINDRKKLKDYSEYLKSTIKKLKNKLQQSEDKQGQERVLSLLESLVDYVRTQYQVQFGNDITPDGDDLPDKLASVEKFIFVATFQSMTAQLNALENSNEADVAWDKIKNELTPLFSNYLQSVLAQENDNILDEQLKKQLESAQQRITNLEKFKQLYFSLQQKLSKSIVEIEALNHNLSEQSSVADNHDAIRLIVEKNKAVYLEMGQMIAMDKEQHHQSVATNMDYSETLINERKGEINRLKGQIAQQFEEIWSLQGRLTGQTSAEPDAVVLTAAIDNISRNLKDAEICIETMDMEIQTLTSEITNLKSQLKESSSSALPEKYQQSMQEKEQIIARFTQESKELINCITGLEDSNSEQSKMLKEWQDKYARLSADFSRLESQNREMK